MTKVAPLPKRKPILTFVRLLGALLLVAVAIPQAWSAPAFAGEVCNNADLQGAYVFSIGGTAITIPPIGPVAILGKITLDGRGNFSGTANGSIAGEFNLLDNPVTGTYSIAGDCTGSWTIIYLNPDGTPGFTGTARLVLVDGIDGRKYAESVGIQPLGQVSTATLKPMFAPAQNNQ